MAISSKVPVSYSDSQLFRQLHVASHWETQSIQQQNSFFEMVNLQ